MDTIWGCDTEAMDEFAERILERVDQLITLIDTLRGASAEVTWIGPDADAHRARVRAVAAEGADLCGILRERSSRIEEESAEQSAASRAEDGAGPGSSTRPAGLGPLVRPFRDLIPDIGRIRRPFTPFPEVDPGFRYPLGVPRRSAGEDFELTEESLERGEKVRRAALGAHPYTRAGQSILDAHEMAGETLDNLEDALVDSGHEELTPAVSAVRIPLDLSSPLIGEYSTAADITHGFDRIVANYSQTGGETLGALADGDIGGAFRAMERGGFRHGENLGRLLIAGPTAHLSEIGGDLAGHVADVVEPLSPAAAEPLRDVERTSHELTERFEGLRDGILDAQSWYEARRGAVQLPWDEQ